MRQPSSSRPLLAKAGDRTCLCVATEASLHSVGQLHSETPRLMKNTQSTCNGLVIVSAVRRKAQAPEGPVEARRAQRLGGSSEASSSSWSINSGKRNPAPPRGAR